MLKRILVTGGGGFIGSHLCEKLLKGGSEVLCVDNFFTGAKDNIAHIMNNPYFEAMRHDITFPLYVEVDEIYNLACPASPIHYQLDPVQTIKTAVHGAINMLGLAKRLKTKVARIFNTYGPRMHLNDGRVVSNFIIQALSGEDITVYGDGIQTRSFCYIDDMVDGLIKLMNTPDDLTGPVNLGNPSEISILELVEKVLKITKSRSKIVYKPLPQDDPVRRCPDITLAKKRLGWQPKTNLEDGLKKTIEYFKRILSDNPRGKEKKLT